MEAAEDVRPRRVREAVRAALAGPAGHGQGGAAARARAAQDEDLLWLCAAVIDATIGAAAAADPPLSATQVRVLTFLAAAADGPGEAEVTVGSVAERLATSVSSASRILARLVVGGLVERAPGRRTERPVRLSPAGRARLDQVNSVRLRLLRTALLDGS